jgi:circadian clock protein KaiB
MSKAAQWVKEPDAVGDRYVFRLYVAGPTSKSARAVINCRRLCEDHLKGRYDLEILNVSEHIQKALKDQVIAAPTLIRLSPPPVRRFIGDMTNTARLVKGFNVGANEH